MNMSEQMKFRANQRHATPKDGISIVNLIRKVKDEPTNNVGEPIRTDIEPINDNDEPIKNLISGDSLSIYKVTAPGARDTPNRGRKR